MRGAALRCSGVRSVLRLETARPSASRTMGQEIMSSLKYEYNCQYDEKDSIGKRYRRQDAIGTPLCVTIDHDSLNDRCVTLRDRDTMQQERVPIEKLAEIVDKKVNLKYLLEKVR